MPLTAAQKQKAYRERLKQNLQKYAKYLENEKSRWQERVQAGKVETIADYSEREHRRFKKIWKRRQKECRERKKMPIVLTPPNSPINIVNDPDNQPDESWQKISGRTDRTRIVHVQKTLAEVCWYCKFRLAKEQDYEVAATCNKQYYT